jgi:hypothetical protein
MKILVAVALSVAAFSAAGHGGEDHGAPPAPVTQSMAPRAVAATEEFEMVAVLEDKQLVVYVDRFASNEPVAKAKVEVDGAGLKGLAAETAPGAYVMALAAPLAAAKHPLTITIEAGDSVDLLSATLDTSTPAATAAHVHDLSEWIVWIVAAVLLLAAGVLLTARRHKKRKGL